MAESIERRFDIAEGYLCSFERKPRFEEAEGDRESQEEKDERKSEKRAYLTIHPLSGSNAREC